MKINKHINAGLFIIFLLTLGFTIYTIKTVSASPADLKQLPTATPTPATAPVAETEEQMPDEEEYDAKFDIKMMESGQFHGEEIKAQSGEIWLGLFNRGGEFFLELTAVEIEAVFDSIVDEEKGEKTGKKVSVAGDAQPLFLLKNAEILKKGKVKTLSYLDDKNEDAYREGVINNQKSRTFKLNNKIYKLFVKTEKEKNEHLDETSKLVLSDGTQEQIIYAQEYCDDCSWEFHWAGDLDGDGKLDLYLDLANHYNVGQKRLFLSSKAGKGELVKEAASFRTVGC